MHDLAFLCVKFSAENGGCTERGDSEHTDFPPSVEGSEIYKNDIDDVTAFALWVGEARNGVGDALSHVEGVRLKY